MHDSERVARMVALSAVVALCWAGGCRSQRPSVPASIDEVKPTLQNPSGDPPPGEIAFVAPGVTTRLHLMSRASERFETLAEGVCADVPPAWSPDGEMIAYCTATEDGGRRAEIMSLPGREAQAPAPEIAAGLAMSWSPDGTRLAMPGTRGELAGIWVVSRDGSGEECAIELEVSRCPWVAWSPTADELAYLWVREEGGVECDIKVLGLGGSDARMVNASIPASATARPAWSPDGRQIAFASAQGQEDVRVCVADVAAGQAEALVATVVTLPDPVWSPDGTRIGFDYAEDMRVFEEDVTGDQVAEVMASIEVYSVTVESGEQKAITDNQFAEGDLAWSPDGRYIAAVADRAGGKKKQLRIVDVETGSSWAVAEADVPESGQAPPDVAQHGVLLRPRWRP